MTEVMGAAPGYQMPLEDQLKQAQERGDAYAEMFEIAGQKAAAAEAEAKRLKTALQFYARHEHWMSLTDDPAALNTNLVAMQGNTCAHGWSVAEEALAT